MDKTLEQAKAVLRDYSPDDAKVGWIHMFASRIVADDAKITEQHVEIERLKDDRNRSGVKARAEFLPVIASLRADNAALKDWLAKMVLQNWCPECGGGYRFKHANNCKLAKMLESK
jgi:hypothetical protein